MHLGSRDNAKNRETTKNFPQKSVFLDYVDYIYIFNKVRMQNVCKEKKMKDSICGASSYKMVACSFFLGHLFEIT